MINDITIDEEVENVYNLESIGLFGELVISSEGKYIMTSDDFFPINSVEDFKLVDDQYVLVNETSKMEIPKDKFEILEKLF